MTIEKLEALEKAATAGPWAYEPILWAFRMAEKAGNTHVPDDLAKDAVYPKCDDAVFMAESRNALSALLAVAKAAKAYCICNEEKEWPHKFEELFKAISRLEAQ